MNCGHAGCLGAFGLMLIAGQAVGSPDGSVLTPDDVRAIAAEMLADADNRSSLLQSGAAGHDGHFFLSDGAGNFRLQVEGQLQTRFTATFVDEDDTVNPDSFESGFTTPRAALAFSGHAWDSSWIYRVSGNFDRAGGGFTLEDAYVAHPINDDGWLLIWGQLRMPVLWEDVINDAHALAVDQSVVNAVFRQDRSQGIWVHYSNDDWRMWAGFSDGIRSENTDFVAEGADWALTSRVEFKLDGEWAQFNQFSSPEGSEQGMKLALAAHWQEGANNMPPEVELGAYTCDFMWEGDGWNLYAAGVGLSTDISGGPNFNDWGFILQGGMFIPETQWEAFGRFDSVLPDGDRAGDDAFNTLTVGFNHYLHGHAAKFTVDAQWFFDATVDNDLVASVATGASGAPGTRIGLLPSANENQLALRMQFQLLF